MGRAEIIEKLDKITDRAAISLKRKLRDDKKKYTAIGTALIEKNTNGFYNVLNRQDKRTLFKDISVFDVAIILAQRYSSGETHTIREILKLEEQYTKYHTDMLHYLNCLKGAKNLKDSVRMAILEDKFQMAEQMAKYTRDRISIFKRVK